jgi:hypothetical protein
VWGWVFDYIYIIWAWDFENNKINRMGKGLVVKILKFEVEGQGQGFQII